jgi:hypothetical protein
MKPRKQSTPVPFAPAELASLLPSRPEAVQAHSPSWEQSLSGTVSGGGVRRPSGLPVDWGTGGVRIGTPEECTNLETEAEPQQIVAQGLLSCLQYPVPYISRLQRI